MKTSGKLLAVLVLGFALLFPAAGAVGDMGRECCRECDCGGHGKPGAQLPMEGMKQHLETMKKAVAELRESEKKLDAAADPKEFRAAAAAHMKKLDDLQESHLGHMESMMGRMPHGAGGMKHAHGGCGQGCDCACGCGSGGTRPCGKECRCGCGGAAPAPGPKR